MEDGDCNDADPEIFPGAIDVCLDGIDQDCSGADRTQGADCPVVSTPPSSGDTGGRTRYNRWRGDDDEHDDEHDDDELDESDDDEREYSGDRDRRWRRSRR